MPQNWPVLQALAAIVPDEGRAAVPIHTTAIAAATAVATILEWVAASALQMEAFMARFQISAFHVFDLRAVRAVRFEVHQKAPAISRNHHLAALSVTLGNYRPKRHAILIVGRRMDVIPSLRGLI